MFDIHVPVNKAEHFGCSVTLKDQNTHILCTQALGDIHQHVNNMRICKDEIHALSSMCWLQKLPTCLYQWENMLYDIGNSHIKSWYVHVKRKKMYNPKILHLIRVNYLFNLLNGLRLASTSWGRLRGIKTSKLPLVIKEEGICKNIVARYVQLSGNRLHPQVFEFLRFNNFRLIPRAASLEPLI